MLDKDGWMRTGDLANLDSSGQLKITGRRKEIKGLPIAKEVIVVGDRRKYLIALIQLDAEVCGKWAQENNIAFATKRDLSRNNKVKVMLKERVLEINKQLARVEQIKKVGLIDKELYHEDGDMTATQKTKRSSICSKFSELIETIYSNDMNELIIDIYNK